MEILRDDINLGKFKAAIFDFDGTISLIRAGWQDVMPVFCGSAGGDSRC